MNPPISIVIRTFNSARTLPLVLERLRLLPGDEIIVVDSGSTDATLAIAEKQAARIFTAEKPFNYSKSLNLGFRAAKNPWVLVISSHCIPVSPEILNAFRPASEFPMSVAVAYGQASLVEMKDESAKVSFVDKLDWERHRRIPGGNGIALYRRTCWEKHPFDETLVTAEDLEWFLWAIATGYIAARVPQAKVLYKNQGNLRHMFRKGWLEAKAARTMLGMKKMTISGLLINVGSLGKRALFNELSPAIFFRQAAHALGAYLAVNFSTPAVEDRKQCGHKEK